MIFTKRRGSSLLLVLLMISGISVVVFASQRLGLVQFSQSNREEDNIFAHYAAQAGIEDGLARYRFSRNAQTEGSRRDPQAAVTFPLDDKFYFGLDSAKNANSNNPDIRAIDDLSYDTAGQYYQLTIMYRSGQFGINKIVNPPSFSSTAKLIKKDTSVTLSGFEYKESPYYLAYLMQFDQACLETGSGSQAFVQLEQIDDSNQSILSQKRVTTTGDVNNDGFITSVETSSNWEIKSKPNSTLNVRLRPYYCDVTIGMVNSISTSGPSTNDPPGPLIDTLTTTITSTGFYGNAKKTLVADIDRVSNSLIGVYDYNLYAGGGNVAPDTGSDAD